MNRTVAVNGRFLAHEVTGVERYASEVLKCIGYRLRLVRPRHHLRGLTGHVWEQLILPVNLGGTKILWSPTNTGPLVVKNQVLTIHDLSPLEHPEWYTISFSSFYRLVLPILIRSVRSILVPAEIVRHKILQSFPIPSDRVHLAPLGVNPDQFRPVDPLQAKSKYGLPEKYILFVGSLQPRKNLGTLMLAWRQVQSAFSDVELVIAGSSGPVFKTPIWPVDAKQVRFLGYVPDPDLAALYSGALVYVLPSLDEGFGLTALEAMACGTPVIASRLGGLLETVGEAGLLVDPTDPDSLAKAVLHLLSDEGLQDTLRQCALQRAQSFSWQRTAECIWNVLQAAA